VQQQEHKWAIFHYQQRIIFVRSWTRQVEVVADIEQQGSSIVVKVIRGSFFKGMSSTDH